jgi:hypothetical protein
MIVRAVRDAGWTADVEVRSPEGNWRADVMAMKGSVRIAFEIQLSTIRFSELVARQRAYAESGVRGCWFYSFGALNPCPPAMTDIPVFALGSGSDSGVVMEMPVLPRSAPADHVKIGNHQLPLAEAVRALLASEFRRCRQQRTLTAHGISIFRFHACWACNKDFDIFCPTQFSATCRDEIPENGAEEWGTTTMKEAGAPWIKRKVQQFVKQNSGMGLMLSFPGWYRAQGSGRNHFTFCCFHCGALVGSEVFEQLFCENECIQSPEYFLAPITTIPLRVTRELIEQAHWCYSKEHRFCSRSVQK